MIAYAPIAGFRRRGGLMLPLAAGLFALWPAVAQVASSPPRAAGQPELASSTQPADDVQITITRAPEQRKLISVPVNQGVLVDFSQPVREVRVAQPDIADVQVTAPRQILVNGKSFGTTQLIAVCDGGAQRVFTIAVDLDLERLQSSVSDAVPRAHVKCSGVLDTVVLSGSVPDAESAERIMQIAQIYSEKVINQMRTAGVQQVLLRVTVAEVNRTATRALGFNGWMGGDNFPDMFLVNNIGGINPVNIGAGASYDISHRVPFGTDQKGLPISGSTTLSFGFPGVQLQVFIRALRENGLLRVLAEPNLVTVSGQEASFLAGGEFPIPVAQRDSIAVDYREYGVKLNFTPAVLSENIIRIKVSPEVSEPDYSNAVQLSGFVVPGLISRRVETNVESGPGQTFAIGGLLSEKTRATSQRVPALGDVPVLGQLFASSEYQHSETELVVLVTPELVEPLNPGQADYVPGAQHVHPNDWEFFALGQLDGQGSGTDFHRVERSHVKPVTAAGDASGTPAAVRLRGPIGPAGEQEGS